MGALPAGSSAALVAARESNARSGSANAVANRLDDFRNVRRGKGMNDVERELRNGATRDACEKRKSAREVPDAYWFFIPGL